MKKYFYLFVFLFIVANSFAQIAGYMGKRATIGYSNYFMLGIKGPWPNSSGFLDERSFTMNNAHCLNFEYAYKQRKMICLSGQYIRTGMAYDRGGHDGFLDAASYREYPYPDGARYGGDFSKPALLTCTNLAIGVKTFKTGFIAPVGRYRKIEVLFIFANVQYDNENFKKAISDNSAEDTLVTLGIGKYSYKNVSFSYTFGNQRVLGNKFVLDYGIRFAYMPSFNIVTLASGDEYANNIEIYYRRQSNLRLARQQFINFHLGIGFLAF